MIYKEFFILISELFLLINSFASLYSSSSSFFGGSLSSWVMVGWVIKFTIAVFAVKVGLDSLTNSDEVINVDLVGDVSVKIVLEMLKHIKVRGNIFISSNSWE